MSNPHTRRIGPFKTGEVPAPLEVQFEDADGVDIGTPGWAAAAAYRTRLRPVVERACSVDADGTALFVWEDGDLDTPGDYDLEVWIGNGTNRFSTRTFIFRVYESIAVPAI